MTNEELKLRILNKYALLTPANRAIQIEIETTLWPIIEAEVTRLRSRIDALIDQSVTDRANYDDEIERLRAELEHLRPEPEEDLESMFARWKSAGLGL